MALPTESKTFADLNAVSSENDSDLLALQQGNPAVGGGSPTPTRKWSLTQLKAWVDAHLASGGASVVGLSQGGNVQDAVRYVTPQMFGAVADGVTDDTAAINAAIEFARTSGRNEVRFPHGTYRTTDTIAPSASVFGMRLLGSGIFGTEILADHTSGPVVLLNRSNGGVTQMTINASASRQAAAATTNNYGLMYDPPDVAGQVCASMHTEKVRIINQPSHGLVHIGNSQKSRYEQVTVQDSGGHGFVFDTGVLTGRTNKSDPSLTTFDTCWALGNAGHGLKVGDPGDDAGSAPVRFLMNNFECADNATDAAVRLTPDEVWLRGLNFTFDTCACGTASAAYAGSIRFAGELLQVRNHRSVRTTRTLFLQQDHVVSRTHAIKVDGLRVLNDAQDPAVVIDDLDNVSDVTLNTYGNASNITSGFTAGAVNCIWEDRPAIQQSVKTTQSQVVNNSNTLVDDDSLQVALAANETVAFELVLRYQTNDTADFKAALVAPSGATVRWNNDLYVATGDAVVIPNSDIVEGATRAFGGSTSGAARSVTIRGQCTMSSTSGFLKVQWAQNTADTSNTLVLAGSRLTVSRSNV